MDRQKDSQSAGQICIYTFALLYIREESILIMLPGSYLWYEILYRTHLQSWVYLPFVQDLEKVWGQSIWVIIHPVRLENFSGGYG